MTQDGRRDVQPLARIVFREGPPLLIEFEFAGQIAPIDPIPVYDTRVIDDAWNRAGRALNELVRQAGGHAPEASKLWEPLSALLSAGRDLGQRLTDQDSQRWNKVQRAFTQARSLGWPTFRSDDIPVVYVVAHGNGFPVELLPVFLPAEGPVTEISNDRQLMRMCEVFLGFSAVVRRIAPETELDERVVDNDPVLPIQFFRYRKLDARGELPRVGKGAGFAQEEAFFNSFPHLQVDGPWPVDEDDDGVKRRMVDALFDFREPLTRSGGERRAVVLAHFACHCNARGNIEDVEVLLSTKAGETRRVRWGELTAGYSERGERPDLPTLSRAAVFFNACGTSSIDPLSSLSFQKFFLTNEHPAFLGTQVAVPEEIAADFAELVYRFFVGGFSMGASVVLARRQLVAGAKNPLGLLYLLHGNDRLEVEKARPEVLPKDFQQQR